MKKWTVEADLTYSRCLWDDPAIPRSVGNGCNQEEQNCVAAMYYDNGTFFINPHLETGPPDWGSLPGAFPEAMQVQVGNAMAKYWIAKQRT